MKRFAFGLLAILCGCGGSSNLGGLSGPVAGNSAPSVAPPSTNQSGTILTRAIEVNDPARSNREIGLNFYFSLADSTPRRVVILSHGGLGTDPNGPGRELSTFPEIASALAQRGFLAIVFGHRVSTSTDQHRIDTTADIRFVLDQLGSGQLSGPVLVNLDKVGASGHSFGAYTVQALGGANYPFGTFRDSRIAAVAPISPQGVGDVFEAFDNGPNDNTWRTLELPTYVLLGGEELDTNGLGQFEAVDWRLQAFANYSSNFDRIQNIIAGQDHLEMSGETNFGEPAVKRFQAANLALFFDVYLNGQGDPCQIGGLEPPGFAVQVSRKISPQGILQQCGP